MFYDRFFFILLFRNNLHAMSIRAHLWKYATLYLKSGFAYAHILCRTERFWPENAKKLAVGLIILSQNISERNPQGYLNTMGLFAREARKMPLFMQN